ncbi:g13249 [Coccomyxa viridis]|uniref:G13249 protein n=1 Tax=Coccomyxa viridis TaxID=1274662 RepID=A0ABP1GGF8_9CHLO
MAKEELDDRFKWDPSNARWVRVKPGKDEDGKYSAENWEKGGVATITPLSGSPYVVWPVIHSKLVKRGLKSVPAEEAYRMQQKGATILDIRPAYQYEAERIEGAVNISTFRPVAGKGKWDVIKKIAMGALAMKATESDPEFGKKAAEQLDKRKKVIVYCGRGGTLKVGNGNARKYNKDDPERMFGIETRSLKACHELLEAGFRDVLHLEGGLSQWRHDDFPVEQS